MEGPAAGSDSDLVQSAGSWAAAANASWLHTTSSGSGNGLAIINFDANTGPTRTGTLTIAGQTLTVTQAGGDYVLSNPLTTLVSSDPNDPQGLAVDAKGNVYVAEYYGNAIEEWNAATGKFGVLVGGLAMPSAVAVDGSGNVYFTDIRDRVLKQWNAATQTVTTLVSFGLASPSGVAVDSSGNVYIADAGDNEIKEWNAATQTVTTLPLPSTVDPFRLAMDASNNLYILDINNSVIDKWDIATQTLSVVVNTGPVSQGFAVDRSGNVYFADHYNNVVEEWNASTQTVSTLVSSGLTGPEGLAVDSSGDVFIADIALRELPRVFVRTDPINEGTAAGSDSLPVLPTAPLTSTLAPTSDKDWLTIGSVSGGTVQFSFSQNTGGNRTAHIDVLGQEITVTQAGILASVALVEPSAAGHGSDVVTVAGPWTATTDAPWLHTSSSGNGDGAATFTFDANTGATRTGTLTIAGETLTVTQAGALGTTALIEGPSAGSDSDIVDVAGPWTVVANASWLHTIASGSGSGLAAFSFDANNGPTRTGTLTIAGDTLTVTQAGGGYVSANMVSAPNVAGVAVDASGNVYFIDNDRNQVEEWLAATNSISTVVSAGLRNPADVAVDGSGNVYIVDAGDNTLKEWNRGTKTLTTLVSSGLGDPQGVAVDAPGNVYIADTGDNAIKEWNAATMTLTTLVSSGLNGPQLVAVDGAGNVYIADSGDNAIKEWNPATKTVTTQVASGISGLYGLAVDHSGNLYYMTYVNNSGGSGLIISAPSGYEIVEWNAATQSSSTLVSPDSKYLDGLAVDGAGNVYFADASDSIGEWNAATQTTSTPIFFGLSSPQGVAVENSGNVYFADPGNNAIVEWNTATQSFNTLVSSGLSRPTGVAVDGSGNVYIADAGDNAIKEWNPVTQTLSTLVSPVTTLQDLQFGIAVDESGNVYFDDSGANKLEEWNAATQTASTLVSSGLSQPAGLAVDALGNVYIADSDDNVIKKWNAATQTLGTLISSGLEQPQGVAVGSTGSLYIVYTDVNSGQIVLGQWNAATQNLESLRTWSDANEQNIAVDGAGNVYAADTVDNLLEEIPLGFLPDGPINEGAAAGSDALAAVLPAGESLTGILAPLSDVAWLTIGNVSGGVVNFSFTTNTGAARTAYIYLLGLPVEVTQSPILATSAVEESAAPGSGSDVVSFAGAWTAASNASWLHTTSSGNGDGTATFTFDANSGPTRTGTLTIAGKTLTVIQGTALGATALLEGAAVGSDSDAVNYAGHWTATANASWLHTTSSGNGSGLATFTYDANPGPTRSGTLTIAGAILTVTQAGNGYVAAGALTTLIPPTPVEPEGLAVDRSGNVYIADNGDNAIKDWNATTHSLVTLVSSGLSGPTAVAVDAAGNVYIADAGDNAIKQWNAATRTVSTLVSSGLKNPESVAVDSAGNVYIANTGDNAIDEWNAQTQTVSPLVSSGLSEPVSLAVDAAGNIDIADFGDFVVREWNAATKTLGTLVTVTSVNDEYRLAVDASGNVYIADVYDYDVMEWNAAAKTVSTLVSSGLNFPEGVAADGAGNVYIADTFDNALKVWSPLTQMLSTLIAPAAGVPTGLAASGAGNLYILGRNASGTAVNEWTAATQTISTLFPTDVNDIAVDSSGNVYLSDGNTVEEWNASTQTVSALLPPELSEASSVAVDGVGNVYIVEQNVEYYITDFVAEWNLASQSLSSLVSSGLGYPQGIAVDAAGNVYVPDTTDATILEWNAATQTVGTLVSSGLGGPDGVAVDGSGNVYVADSGDNTIKEWNAATKTLATLVSSGLELPSQVAVDAAGNVYILDTGDDAIEELPRAFVPGGPNNEGTAAGSGSLAAVLPAGQSLAGVFAPASNASWLTIGSVSAGVVNFSFTQNTGAARTAEITLLGRQIAVTQSGTAAAPGVGEEIVDNSQPGFWSSASSNWTITNNGLGGSSLISSTPNGSEKSQAAWWFTMPAGVYEISITYTAGSNLTKDMGLDLYDGVGKWMCQIPVDEQVAPDSFMEDGVAWENLGAFRLTSNIFHISTWNSSTDGAICVNGIQLQSAPIVDDANVLDGYTYYPPTGSVGSFSTTGSWTTGAQGAFGGSRVSTGALGSGSSKATWNMPVKPGSYEVDVTWPASASLSASATYNVYNSGIKLASVAVDQQTSPSGVAYDGANWLSLGRFTISTTQLIVTLANTAGDGQVDADAVRILPAYQPTPIVANVNYPGFWSGSNGWTARYAGLYGTSLVSDTPNGSKQSQAAWSFPVQPGNYQVYVTWLPGSNLSPTAPFDVYNAQTYISEAVVNEQVAPVGVTDQGVAWQSLGTFTITSDALHVSTWNSQTNGAMNVSGIRIVPLST